MEDLILSVDEACDAYLANHFIGKGRVGPSIEGVGKDIDAQRLLAHNHSLFRNWTGHPGWAPGFMENNLWYAP